MEETNNEQIEINLIEIYKTLKKHWRLIVGMVVIAAAVFFLVSSFFLSKKYASESTLLLTPKVTAVSYTHLDVYKRQRPFLRRSCMRQPLNLGRWATISWDMSKP